jgi:DNA polymerase/3'-5' exonuclease PolX
MTDIKTITTDIKTITTDIKTITIDKEKIIIQFTDLVKQIKIDIENSSGKKKIQNTFRLQSIQNAIKVLSKLKDKNITINKIKDLKGIGSGTIRRIEEIIKTGKLSEIKITTKDEKFLKLMDELEESYGIGKKTAYTLFKEHNIKSMDDLISKVNSGEIVLSDVAMKGLKYYGKITTKIPRKIIDSARELILDILFKIDSELFGAICGSYRRMKETSGDIDLIVVHPKIKTKTDLKKNKYFQIIIKTLKFNGFIIESLTGDDVESKFMGIFSYQGIIGRIDIRFIPFKSFYFAYLYFTGGVDLNKNMRLIAISHGYKLNEYGLYKDGSSKSVIVESEKEIFDILGLNYLQPKDRS